MATHSSILARKILWTEEPGGLQSTGPESDVTEHVHTHTHTHPHNQNIRGASQATRKEAILLWHKKHLNTGYFLDK